MIIERLTRVQQPLNDIMGAVIGGFGQMIANDQQHEHNKEMMGIQHGYNEQSAEAAYQRQRELNAENWRLYNSYEAQRASMEAAGLSPALMYGMRGAGGSGAGNTAAQGQGVGLPQSIVGNVGAAAVQGAQLGLIKAQTDKTEAEAEQINQTLPKTLETMDKTIEKLGEEINNLISLTQNNEAKTRLTQLQADAQDFQNAFNDLTLNDQLTRMHDLSAQAHYTAEAMKWDLRDKEDAHKIEGYNQFVADWNKTQSEIALNWIKNAAEAQGLALTAAEIGKVTAEMEYYYSLSANVNEKTKYIRIEFIRDTVFGSIDRALDIANLAISAINHMPVMVSYSKGTTTTHTDHKGRKSTTTTTETYSENKTK